MLLSQLAQPSGGLRRRSASNVHVTSMFSSHYFKLIHNQDERMMLHGRGRNVGLLLVALPVLLMAHIGGWRWRMMVGWVAGKVVFIWLVFLLSSSPNFFLYFCMKSTPIYRG